MSWSDHVSGICGKIYGVLRKLWKVRDCLPIETARRLVIALIFPYLNYASVVYSSSLDSVSFRKIDIAYNSCIRFVNCLRKYDRISHFKNAIDGLTVVQRFQYKIILFIRELLVNRLPNYLFRKLRFGTSQRNVNLIVPVNRSSMYNNTFFVRGVVLWNSLPASLRRIHASNSFRREIKSFLILS